MNRSVSVRRRGWTTSFALIFALSLWLGCAAADSPYVPYVPQIPYVDPIIIIDIFPPVTNVSLSGTKGENGWYTSDVTVTLKATDATGVDKTFYTLYAEGQTIGTLRTYTAPFKVTAQGKSRLSYYSIDTLGYTESAKIENIWVDKGAPEGSVVIAGGTEYATSPSVSLTLSAIDAVSGVLQMRFRNDEGSWSAWEAFSATKEWELGSQDGLRRVSAQFGDMAGLVSAIYQDDIVLDTLPPSLMSPTVNGTKIKSSSYSLNWTAMDQGSGVDRYEVRVDGGAWTTTGATPSYTFSDLADGVHTFEVKAIDKAGRSQALSVDIIVNRSPIGGPGYLEEMLLIVMVVAVAGAVIFFLMRKRSKKPPAPERLKLSAEPGEIVADGRSTSTLTVALLDKSGKPAAATGDMEIRLATNIGRLVDPAVRIKKGASSGATVIASTTQFGPASVSAESSGLETGTVTLNFKEKPRFCMGCGARMSVRDTRCSKCGASPAHFGGPETKTCHCGAVLPQTASYCSECGAKQPPVAGTMSQQPPAMG